MHVPNNLLEPLKEGIQNHVGGEVVIRTATDTGRIYVYGGAVAWVTCTTINTRLGNVLEAYANVSRDDLDAAIKECQKTRRNFAETLLSWGLIDAQTLRRCLLFHNAQHFIGLTKLGTDLKALFVPQARHYSAELLFTLDDVLLACDRIVDNAKEKQGSLVSWGDSLQDIYHSLPQCIGVAAIDTEAGEVRGHWPVQSEVPGYGSDSAVEAVRAFKSENLARLVFSDGQSPWDKDARIQPTQMVHIDEHVIQIMRRSSIAPHLLLVCICEATANLGMALGMMRSGMQELEEEPGGQLQFEALRKDKGASDADAGLVMASEASVS